MGLRFLCFWPVQNAGMGNFRVRPCLLAHQLFFHGQPKDHPLESPREKIFRNGTVITVFYLRLVLGACIKRELA